MNKIESVTIEGFWGDKTVQLKFNENVNFLIGVNGSGKTTIINLIAATIKADYTTLNRTVFDKLLITLKPQVESKSKKTAYIEIERKVKEISMYNELSYRIKNYSEVNAKKYTLLDRGDDAWYYSTHHHSYISQTYVGNSKQNELKSALDSLVNLSWLTIHRVSSSSRKEEKSFESTIDQKIGELQIDLVKYFSVLNRKYTVETERFQKYIFESMIDVVNDATILPSKDINPEKEKSSLKQIFYHFQLPERAINQKLDNYFNSFEKAVLRIKESKELTISDLAYTIGIRRIHAVVQEWNKVIDKQKEINKSKETFLSLINSLLQRKSLFINERNELTVRTQSGKIFPLTNLSSGEKQLLIILGQSLLQEENIHVYIADEPELSLHIEWQEKLVKSLKSLNPNSQIIFATHSPDIVGEFGKYVIKVEEAIR